MAGGSGTRFWPLSRRKHPKQLLTLFGQDSLLEQTVARIQPVIPLDHIYIFTSEADTEEGSPAFAAYSFRSDCWRAGIAEYRSHAGSRRT